MASEMSGVAVQADAVQERHKIGMWVNLFFCKTAYRTDLN